MSNEQKFWYVIDVTAQPEAAEAIEFAMNELDALGTEINNLRKKQDEPIRVSGYFDNEPDEENLRLQINEALRIYDFEPEAVSLIEWRRLGDVDWLYNWKQHWKPTETGRFIVSPTWETPDDADKIIVYIDPNMAFGTGTHETTRLCLLAIEANYKNGMTLLDVGTGTGILAIGARKFADDKTPRFVGCDTDENSIVIAKENAELNGIGNIEFYAGSIDETTANADFVLANLTIDVITPLLPLLLGKFNKVLILSGILQEQENVIIEELQKFGIENPEINHSGEWISVTINK